MSLLLSVRDLKVTFATTAGTARAVRGISFDLSAGESLAIVGESGSGKSVTAQSIIRLIPGPAITGSIFFAGQDLLSMSDRELRQVRGKQIGMVFQDPMTSLNPTMTAGYQIMEAIAAHSGHAHSATKARAIEMMEMVGLSPASSRFLQYPHQLSGGMRQRVMIAIALACNPKLLIADEPVTALDMATQAQVLDLLRNINYKSQTSIILISHDLSLVANFSSRVLVMYAGLIIEAGLTVDIFLRPQHPYTRALLASAPRQAMEPGHKLASIAGAPPDPVNLPSGCAFWPRCDSAMHICRELPPPETRLSETHRVGCWLTHPYAAGASNGKAN